MSAEEALPVLDPETIVLGFLGMLNDLGLMTAKIGGSVGFEMLDSDQGWYIDLSSAGGSMLPRPANDADVVVAGTAEGLRSFFLTPGAIPKLKESGDLKVMGDVSILAKLIALLGKGHSPHQRPDWSES